MRKAPRYSDLMLHRALRDVSRHPLAGIPILWWTPFVAGLAAQSIFRRICPAAELDGPTFSSVRRPAHGHVAQRSRVALEHPGKLPASISRREPD